MDIYHAWCDLKPGVSDLEFSANVVKYMEHLTEKGLVAGWRLMRCKLGFRTNELGDFHLMIEVDDMKQLESAFERVGSRRDPAESLHFGVNSLVRNARFALYRDFPDSFRHRGEEKF
jgi:hypothetical protein